MAQNVQELINKIKQDGLEVAQKKAQDIEAAAQKKADEIVATAKTQAHQMISDAKTAQKQLEDSSRAALRQAARDTVLALKQEIIHILTGIIRKEAGAALQSDQTAQLIVELIKAFAVHHAAGGVEIVMNENSRNRLEKDLLGKLQKEIKTSVVIKTAEDVTGGFTISFDDGKSCFDFSEDALTEYLGMYVNAYVKDLLEIKNA